jgi:hypothetical protein
MIGDVVVRREKIKARIIRSVVQMQYNHSGVGSIRFLEASQHVRSVTRQAGYSSCRVEYPGHGNRPAAKNGMRRHLRPVLYRTGLTCPVPPYQLLYHPLVCFVCFKRRRTGMPVIYPQRVSDLFPSRGE